MPPLIGLLPAAGRGVRAYPHTATVPKSMLDVDGVPNLQRNVELLRDQLGVRDVRIVVGHHGEVIKRHFEDGARFGVAITYVDNPRVDLELPFSVYQAGRAIDQPCVMLLADECYVGSNHAELLAAADPTAEVVLGQIAAEYAKQIRKNYACRRARRRDRGPDRETDPSRRPHDGRRHLSAAAGDLPPPRSRLRAAATNRVRAIGPRGSPAWRAPGCA